MGTVMALIGFVAMEVRMRACDVWVQRSGADPASSYFIVFVINAQICTDSITVASL